MPTTVTATATHTVTLKPSQRKRLLTDLKVWNELRSQVKILEQAMETHKAAIEAVRAETGESMLELDGFKITYVTPAGRVDPKVFVQRLLAEGVSMRQVEDAQAGSKKDVKAYVKITAPGEREVDYGNGR